MKKNEYGIYIEGTEKIKIEDDSGTLTIIKGNENGKFGYAFGINTRAGGEGYGLSERDLVYNTESEMTTNIKKNMPVIIERYCGIESVLLEKFREKFNPEQLELF